MKGSASATAAMSLVGLLAVLSPPLSATSRADTPAEASPAMLLQTKCGGCHQSTTPGQYARISSIRKTPEGWLMTIFRMQHVHGLQLNGADRDALVRYLADTRGLAPAESAPARFALERRPNMQDLQLPSDPKTDLQTMCARCHSAARVALQRRDAAEWLKLVNWHLVQFPSIEYQDKARDRMWWQVASTLVPSELGRLFPLHTQAWEDWQRKPAADLSGHWWVHGHQPGRGDYWGTAELQKTAAGEYKATYQLEDEAGNHFDGDSSAVVYTGYEWRGSGRLGERLTQEVFALSEDGHTLSGRWFAPTHAEEGGDWVATRGMQSPRIVAVSPVAAHIGSTCRVTIFGDQLAGTVTFGPGTKVKVIRRSANTILVEVAVTPVAKGGYVPLRVGKLSAADLFAAYDRVDRLEVTPHYAIARLGGGGGKIDPVSAQFEASAYLDLHGPGDDVIPVRLGNLPVHWRVSPYNEDARVAQDVKYAGEIDPSGKFLPAAAGPNPERKYSGNNSGDLSVSANLVDTTGASTVGKAHLIVTIQRWNTPPIY